MQAKDQLPQSASVDADGIRYEVTLFHDKEGFDEHYDDLTDTERSAHDRGEWCYAAVAVRPVIGGCELTWDWSVQSLYGNAYGRFPGLPRDLKAIAEDTVPGLITATRASLARLAGELVPVEPVIVRELYPPAERAECVIRYHGQERAV